MSTQVQLRRGSTTEHNSFTGAAGEVTVDTTKKTLVVHDGSTAGGVPLAKESALSSYLTTTAAGTTYAPLASPTFTGTVTIPAGASISGYLTTASAASTYQTQAGMSGYLTTGAVGTTVQAYDANTAKTNVAQSYSAAQRGTHVTLTDGATITPDFAAGNHFTVTLGGNRTLANPTNLTAGQSGVIYVVQDGTGSRTLAYGSNWDFAGGTAPTLSTAANAVDVLCYAVRSNSSIAATLVKDVK